MMRAKPLIVPFTLLELALVGLQSSVSQQSESIRWALLQKAASNSVVFACVKIGYFFATRRASCW